MVSTDFDWQSSCLRNLYCSLAIAPIRRERDIHHAGFVLPSVHEYHLHYYKTEIQLRSLSVDTAESFTVKMLDQASSV